jgi:Uma2 family endonuclease
MSVEVLRRHFSVEEYYRMAAAGVLSEDDRVELIEGEIIEMNPIGSRHAACVGRLTELLGKQATDIAIVWVQNPVQLDEHSEPVPDVTLLRRREDFYARANPRASDALLVVEVSDSTLRYDREVKVPLYARAGVPEVWLVNLPEEVVEIYARPSGGVYQETRSAGRGERLTATALPALALDADAVLG